MNSWMGKALLCIGSFFLAINLYDLLPHAGGINASWDKVLFSAVLIALGAIWTKQAKKI